ncbi:wobble nucleotide-excising tRNase [Pseudomonas sp. JAI115]|uniref:AAA family ATPase n=1 Tax=Pseudomonas sp. JAI115 TaxID=2723061 RepID=UPI0016133974|nr:AAA family ATPase [Pseudomonas sp. JAI115]MBB6157535.1 wobble nucleotide-excising tRNase [Pseudomonas sp. JAI115]
MIESIRLAIATYTDPVTINGLKEINFFYGANGAGKTSIGRVIEHPESYLLSDVQWKNGRRVETMVYNQDFMERNFNQVANLKGVFTLGETQQAKLDEITVLKKDIERLEAGRQSLKTALIGTDETGGKRQELIVLEEQFKDKCWAQKRKHDEAFHGAFQGLRNNAEKFKDRVLQEARGSASQFLQLPDLTKKAELLYGEKPKSEVVIHSINFNALTEYEKAPILGTKIIGKSDVDIAAMIERLNNSDWVRQGIKYFNENDGECPFCQQQTTKDFERSLTEYFDDSFEKNTLAIDVLRGNYQDTSTMILQQLHAILVPESKFLDHDKLVPLIDLLTTETRTNLEKIHLKKATPSLVIELKSTASTCEKILDLISDANQQIYRHNDVVANFDREYDELTGEIWKYLLEVELKEEIKHYLRQKAALEGAITGLATKIRVGETVIEVKKEELDKLERASTTIEPTARAINKLLKGFGFHGFKLAVASTESSYKLVRSNGADAKGTLSEGEKTFVTFLYFYHLLKGSASTVGTTNDRVVVIDDPVSSLDSDVLFIVSSLIKQLFEEVKTNTGYIKQVFIFTHNIYFHKEITFNHERKKNALPYETFWVIRKSDQKSKIESHAGNPIKTSYDLLWSELKRPDINNTTIQNTLRRILENYFKILGSTDPHTLYKHFDGADKIHCRSLLSWVNDGSHFAHDDLYLAIEDSMVENYRRVFFKIFDHSGHLAHYKMMMGDAYVDLNVAEEPVAKEEAEVQVAIEQQAAVEADASPIVLATKGQNVDHPSGLPPITVPAAATSEEVLQPKSDLF